MSDSETNFVALARDPAVLPDINSDALLGRRQTAAELTARGFQIAEATLATCATRGGGPKFKKFGKRVLYRWGDAIGWAQGRLTDAVTTTSELESGAA